MTAEMNGEIERQKLMSAVQRLVIAEKTKEIERLQKLQKNHDKNIVQKVEKI